jgi:uncharacterized membrane protein YqjE
MHDILERTWRMGQTDSVVFIRARDTEEAGNRKQPAEAEVQRLRDLQTRLRLLEVQLQSQKPHLQLYRIGASTLLVSVASLVSWGMMGIAAPFHPIFALVVAPASVAIVAMAYLVKAR